MTFIICAGVTTGLNTNLGIGSEFGIGNREKCCKLICEIYLNVLSTKLAEPVCKMSIKLISDTPFHF